ncbi:MAG: DUF1549 and DUF1553 domain-containing protein [Pirellulaceae bacterium]
MPKTASASACFLLLLTATVCLLRADEADYSDSERSHWAFQPVARPAPPGFINERDRAWVRTPIDAFILARLKENDLTPAEPADRATLIRRLSFDLTGLPPAPKDVAAFLTDDAPDAYERLVDRLLASPRYGEQWGQHWLDVVRFAETEGFEYDAHRAGAWRYRDYVINALNVDTPYDRFLLEQIAGDELRIEGEAFDEGDQSLLVAAGFHRLGPVRRNAGNAEVAFSRNEVLTERTNIIGAALLGLTLGCARCHDHMFDPIRQKDYYHIQAFLAASYEHDIPLDGPQRRADWQKQTDAIKNQLAKLKEKLDDAPIDRQDEIRAQMQRLEAQLPAPLPTISTVRNDDAQRTAIHLLDRGDPAKPTGERLGLRPLGVLLPEPFEAYPPDAENPKLLLARWIVDRRNPLTARVLVNRLWQGCFGRAIVATPNDFGANGETPTHPQLLDYLASELMRGGWRIKPIQRQIVLSSTYRQSSQRSDSLRAVEIDSDNRLLWKQNRRRLGAGELRDAMLTVSGRLNSTEGGPSVMLPVEQEMIDLLYKPSQWRAAEDPRQFDRRSVYLIAKRNLRVPFMEVFDQPDLQTSCSRRETSTHAPQALEMLNGRLSNELATAFATRLRREAGDSPQRQVERAFQLVTGGRPSDSQLRLAIAFLETQTLEEFALAMFNLNGFLYVD